MSRSLTGGGIGVIVVLIGFLVLIYIGTSAASQAVAGSIFGLILLAFMFLFVFLLLGRGGRAGMRW